MGTERRFNKGDIIVCIKDSFSSYNASKSVKDDTYVIKECFIDEVNNSGTTTTVKGQVLMFESQAMSNMHIYFKADNFRLATKREIEVFKEKGPHILNTISIDDIFASLDKLEQKFTH